MDSIAKPSAKSVIKFSIQKTVIGKCGQGCVLSIRRQAEVNLLMKPLCGPNLACPFPSIGSKKARLINE